jgi:hypothetical protein
MAGMGSNPVSRPRAKPGAISAALALGWASMGAAVVSLPLVISYLLDALGTELASSCLVLVSALCMAAVALWLLPEGRPHHDFAVGAFRTTLLLVGLASLLLGVAIYSAPTGG